jgi:phage terminase large subunit-like protein
MDFLEEQYFKYLNYPHDKTSVLTKSFNIWCKSKEESMFQDDLVIDCMSDKVEFDINHLVYVGIDL